MRISHSRLAVDSASSARSAVPSGVPSTAMELTGASVTGPSGPAVWATMVCSRVPLRTVPVSESIQATRSVVAA